ncbi:hypothetical protein HKX48_009474 [Thoreauomyces humboldtii]|nr:hypothetical protein HKX48_009474 [Thoreauomyces humboldtii]
MLLKADHASSMAEMSIFSAYLRKPDMRPGTAHVHFYDSKVNTTYILVHATPNIVVSVIHLGKVEEKRGGGTAVAFVQKLARMLEHSDVFAYSKTRPYL